MTIKLTATDKAALKSLDDKLAEVKNMTTLCACGDLHGLYIWGEGGIGKSYTVIQRLKQLKAEYHLQNTRLSGRAFYRLLEKHIDKVHLLEDVENIFIERSAMNLVRSATWGQKDERGKQHRPVCWGVFSNDGVELECDFEGSVIFTGNRALAKIPELKALATRIETIEVIVTYDEIVARMKEMSLAGYKTNKGSLTPKQCGEVLEIILEEMAAHPQPFIPDIRRYELCLRQRIGADRLGKELSGTWETMVRKSIRQWLRSRNTEQPTRQRLSAADLDKAIEISKLGLSKKEIAIKWMEVTGKTNLDGYYRLLRKATR